MSPSLFISVHWFERSFQLLGWLQSSCLVLGEFYGGDFCQSAPGPVTFVKCASSVCFCCQALSWKSSSAWLEVFDVSLFQASLPQEILGHLVMCYGHEALIVSKVIHVPDSIPGKFF